MSYQALKSEEAWWENNDKRYVIDTDLALHEVTFHNGKRYFYPGRLNREEIEKNDGPIKEFKQAKYRKEADKSLKWLLERAKIVWQCNIKGMEQKGTIWEFKGALPVKMMKVINHIYHINEKVEINGLSWEVKTQINGARKKGYAYYHIRIKNEPVLKDMGVTPDMIGDVIVDEK